jgi:hypothetical protein
VKKGKGKGKEEEEEMWKGYSLLTITSSELAFLFPGFVG